MNPEYRPSQTDATKEDIQAYVRAKNLNFAENYRGESTYRTFLDVVMRPRQRAERFKPVHNTPIGSWWFDPEANRTIEVVYHKGDRIVQFERYPDVNAPGTCYEMTVDRFLAKFAPLDKEAYDKLFAWNNVQGGLRPATKEK